MKVIVLLPVDFRVTGATKKVSSCKHMLPGITFSARKHEIGSNISYYCGSLVHENFCSFQHTTTIYGENIMKVTKDLFNKWANAFLEILEDQDQGKHPKKASGPFWAMFFNNDGRHIPMYGASEPYRVLAVRKIMSFPIEPSLTMKLSASNRTVAFLNEHCIMLNIKGSNKYITVQHTTFVVGTVDLHLYFYSFRLPCVNLRNQYLLPCIVVNISSLRPQKMTTYNNAIGDHSYCINLVLGQVVDGLKIIIKKQKHRWSGR